MERASERVRGVRLPGGRVGAAWLVALAIALLAPTAASAAHERLPAPPFPPPIGEVEHRAGSPRLVLGSSAPNAIVDVRAWFRRNGIVPAEWAVAPGGDIPAPALPARFARSFRGADLVRAIDDRPRRLALLVYGGDGSGRYVVGADRRTGDVQWSYDLGAWAFPAGTPANRRGFPQGVVWATVRAGVLYVSTAHNTFASESRGRTAYIRAIDLGTSKLRWTSRALVANAGTFAITSGVVVAGYGFTQERDRLFLLDVRTGRAVDDLDVPSAPEYIALQRGALLVRTYDHDLVVRLARG